MIEVPLLDLQKVVDGFVSELDRINILDNTAAFRVDPNRSTSILDRIHAARWGTSDDLKGAVVFHASSASDYLNRAIIPVDGGWLAR